VRRREEVDAPFIGIENQHRVRELEPAEVQEVIELAEREALGDPVAGRDEEHASAGAPQLRHQLLPTGVVDLLRVLHSRPVEETLLVTRRRALLGW